MISLIARPNENELSLSMDEYDTKKDESGLLAGRVDVQISVIGVYFIKEELIDKLPKSHQKVATKSSRFFKWK